MKKISRILTFVLLFLAGCSPVTSIPTATNPLVPDQISEAARFDAESYAGIYQVSVDEALRRFYLMEEAGSLQARLMEKEAHTFAGLWIEHEPEFLVVVAFTRNGDKTLRPYLKNTHLSAVIELRSAERSYQDLLTAEMLANQLVNQLRLSLIASTMVNIQENRAEIHIAYPALLESRLREAGRQIPDNVAVIAPPENPTAETPLLVTPVPGVFLPQLTVAPAMIYADLEIVRLFLQGECLRAGEPGDESSVLIFPPGYYLNDNQGTLEVLNNRGEPVVRAGEISCLSHAAGDADEAVGQFLNQPLPESCGPPYELVGQIELADWQGRPRSLMAAELSPLGDAAFYILQAQPPLLDWLAEPREFSGTLTRGYEPRSRCLVLRDWGGPGDDLLLLWPAGSQTCLEGEQPALCDAQGQVLASLGTEIHFTGSFIEDGEAIRASVNSELPCDCVGGAYVVVGSVGK